MHFLVISSKSAKYGAFLRTGGTGASRQRSSHKCWSIGSVRTFKLPLSAISHRLYWSYTRGWLSWMVSTTSFAALKLVSSWDARISASSAGSFCRSVALYFEKKDAICKLVRNSDDWKSRTPSAPRARRSSLATTSESSLQAPLSSAKGGALWEPRGRTVSDAGWPSYSDI